MTANRPSTYSDLASHGFVEHQHQSHDVNPPTTPLPKRNDQGAVVTVREMEHGEASPGTDGGRKVE
jgi:hypothetical protein